MARFEFKLPDIGEGVSEGEIVSWLAQVGETVTEDQELVEVMTDKATVTIGAPKAGRVLELRGEPGQMVAVGAVLVVLEVSGEASAVGSGVAPSEPAAPTAPRDESAGSGGRGRSAPPASTPVADGSGGPVGNLREDLPGLGAASPDDADSREGGPQLSEPPLAAPATRRLARELGVDLRRVPATGKAGRITAEDVERFAAEDRREPGSVATPSSAKAPSVPTGVSGGEGSEERTPIRGLRKRIFENMARSKHTAAHFHYVEECDVGALMALRERVLPLAAAEKTKLTYLPFIIKAVVTALQRHPDLNCWVDDAKSEIVRRPSHDIGLAVATSAGLIVPVVRRADRLSILAIAREIERLAEAARIGKTQPADLGGSVFTVTSLGKLGGLVAPPIINYPEVGIMGVHAIKRRPVVRGDEIAIGNVMLLSWSFDHRIIDGHVAAAFAQEIVGLLESPERLLVSMS